MGREQGGVGWEGGERGVGMIRSGAFKRSERSGSARVCGLGQLALHSAAEEKRESGRCVQSSFE
jgi:hypothetical protein